MQPQACRNRPYMSARTRAEVDAALEMVGVPAVLKPADASGQRGLFLLNECTTTSSAAFQKQSRLPHAERRFSRHSVDGDEVNCLVVVRNGEATVITVSDRLRTSGVGFGVGSRTCTHPRFPRSSARSRRASHVNATLALGLRNGIAFPQLLATPDRSVEIVEVAARIPGGQMGEVARHGVGVDLLDVALQQALGEAVPDDVAVPRFTQPLAIRFFTAEPGPLPTGESSRIGEPRPPSSSRRASCKPTPTSRSVRRFAPCAGTATAEGTSSPWALRPKRRSRVPSTRPGCSRSRWRR